jgi:hypothetical protein
MMEDAMAKVIEFYIPEFFLRKVDCIAPHERGKLIEFRSPKSNQPDSNSVDWHVIGPKYIGFAVNFASDGPGDRV